MESLPTSVQELKTGLFRVIWNTNSNKRNNGGYRHNYSSLNCSSKVDLTSLGVDECYEIQSSMDNNNGNAYNQIPVLKLTITTSDENIDNFKQRKINARFLGYDKEMVFFYWTSNATSGIKEVTRKSEIDGREIDRWIERAESHPRRKQSICLEWAARWTEIQRIGCPSCSASLGMAESFEIFIDMEPTTPLKQGQENVLSHIAQLWKSKTLSDVTFRCQNRDIKAHTLIVSSGSPVLAAMFQSDFKEKQDRIAIIKETTADVFEKLLYFIYTGDIDFKFKNIAALMVAADMYNVDSLKNECDLYLSKNVTLADATKYLILSHLHNAKKLYKATLIFMQQNSEVICSRPDWMELFKKYPELGFVAMQFMVKKN